ncbi:DUF2490 domain-containing protein [Flavobacterium sp. xlx-214]|uniref:DUF2490 domain-containing protein n=1 Tax=unclassified Flavobacterium TaxID=196869 RepID=UPI0013D0BFED|nr:MULTISPECIES: DUF2490 domain-containing protein [unclassified Flavobacterium]MBA5793232.1 DUF2490 domain-containing protein [Flavobacterium sp. xlx-221]QMI82485.1 DUF2490 domain-containing protein [Flavobacterium sp. xlx-214]
MKKITLVLISLFLTTNLWANSPPLGGWYMYFGNTTFKDSKWKANYDVQYRNHELASDLNQLVVRTSAQYQVMNNLNVALGYAYVHSEHINTPDLPYYENRIFQDVSTQQNYGASVLKHRFRLEQRFIENQDYKSRIRYQLGIEIPVYKNEEKNQSIYTTAYNEVFMNLDKASRSKNAFDRNRLYLGAGYKFNKDVSMQIGWMNQMLQKQSYQQLMISLHHSLSIK